MSKTTKKKHVTMEVLNTFALPNNCQEIAKVISGKGNNLHEVENTTGEQFLASMPTKFRKIVWIKRGDFVILEPIQEGEKVKAEIVQILHKDQIKYIKEKGHWPSHFDDTSKKVYEEKVFPDSDSDTDTICNMNWTSTICPSESSDEEKVEEN